MSMYAASKWAVLGWSESLLLLLRGLLPARLFDKIVGRGFNVYTSMDHFAGRPTAEAVPLQKNTFNV